MKPVHYVIVLIVAINLLLAYMCVKEVKMLSLYVEQQTESLAKEHSKLLEKERAIQRDTKRYASVQVSVSAYPPLSKCTDSTPLITASNKRVEWGIVALSRDIEKDYGYKFGDMVHIAGIGTFRFEDRMNKRIKRGVDIFMWDEKECLQFGRRTAMLIVDKGEP